MSTKAKAIALLMLLTISITEKISAVTPGNDSWRAVIWANDYYGRVLSRHFYDLKLSPSALSSRSRAKEIITDGCMSGLRIPIYGTITAPSHPKQGKVKGNYYAATVASVKNALAVNPDLVIFASKKLQNMDGSFGSFPDWVKMDPKDNKSAVDPKKYVHMLFDYISYMKKQGIEIDVLGIDNEREYSKSKMLAPQYAETVILLKEMLTEAGFKIPLFIGPEAFRVPNKGKFHRNNNWMAEITSNDEYASTLDIYGIHYYENVRDKHYNFLKTDLELKGDRECWATEPHWNRHYDSKVYTDHMHYGEDAVGAIWDMTDLGLDNIIWWSYTPANTLRGQVMRASTIPIIGAQPIRMVDHDGFEIREPRLLQSRAFRRGDTIIFYVLNICGKLDRNTSYTNYEFLVAGATITGPATVQQWRDNTERKDGTNLGELTIVRPQNNAIYLNLPSRSVTMVTITVK